MPVAIDIAKIDAKIKRLKMLKVLASDPETASLLEELVTPNGSKPRRPAAKQKRIGPRKGEQEKAVVKAVSAMPGRFTTLEIIEMMRRAGFKFAAKRPTVAVNSVLRKLQKRDQLTVAVKGAGRAGHQYQRVSQVSAP